MTDLTRARDLWRMGCDAHDVNRRLEAVTIAVGAILDHLEATEPARREPVVKITLDPETLADRLGAVVKSAPPPIAPDRPDNWQPTVGERSVNWTPCADLIVLAYAAFSRPQLTPTVDGFCRWLDCGPALRHLIETTLENP